MWNEIRPLSITVGLYADAAGDEQQIVGGEPMMLTGNIVLCGRSTGDATRGYSGRLAELAIWNNALTAPQILAIFQQVYCYLGPALLQC